MLAEELADPVRQAGRDVIRASIDGFHKPRALRYARGAESAAGYFLDSFDYETLKRELLRPLGPGGNLSYRRAVFDYRVDSPVETATETALPNSVLSPVNDRGHANTLR